MVPPLKCIFSSLLFAPRLPDRRVLRLMVKTIVVVQIVLRELAGFSRVVGKTLVVLIRDDVVVFVTASHGTPPRDAWHLMSVLNARETASGAPCQWRHGKAIALQTPG